LMQLLPAYRFSTVLYTIYSYILYMNIWHSFPLKKYPQKMRPNPDFATLILVLKSQNYESIFYRHRDLVLRPSAPAGGHLSTDRRWCHQDSGGPGWQAAAQAAACGQLE
jgi:hypothetical protein